MVICNVSIIHYFPENAEYVILFRMNYTCLVFSCCVPGLKLDKTKLWLSLSFSWTLYKSSLVKNRNMYSAFKRQAGSEYRVLLYFLAVLHQLSLIIYLIYKKCYWCKWRGCQDWASSSSEASGKPYVLLQLTQTTQHFVVLPSVLIIKGTVHPKM